MTSVPECNDSPLERERNRCDLPFLGMPFASPRASPGRVPALWCSVHLQAGLGTPFVPRTRKVKGTFKSSVRRRSFGGRPCDGV